MADSDEDIEEITSMESSTRKQNDIMDDDMSSSTESDVSEKHLTNSAVDTGRGHSVSLDTDITNVMKLQKQVQSLQRQLDKEHRTKVSLENKCQSLETQKVELNNKLAGLSRDKRTLEETKIELEAKLRNLQVTLSTEQQKRANVDIIIVRTKEQLARSEDQCKTETESRQKLEGVVRSLRSQLETERHALTQMEADKENAMKQLETDIRLKSSREQEQYGAPSTDGDDDMSQTGSTNIYELTAELAAVKALLNQRVQEEDEDKQRIVEENEVLQKQIEKLKQDLDLDAHTLSETTVRYNLEIGSLNNKLQEMTEKQLTELSQVKGLLDARLKDLEETQRKRTEMETTYKRQHEELQRELEQCHQQLKKSKEESEAHVAKQSETELKLKQAVNQLSVLKSSDEERTSFYSDLQKQLNNEQTECEKLRERLRAEQEASIHSRTKIESLQQRVDSLQEEAAVLRDNAEETKKQNSKQSEQLMSVIDDVKQDYQQMQSELKNQNESLETKVDELMKTLSAVETERDGLRNELNDALTTLEDGKRKLSTAHQAKSSLENERIDLENKLKMVEHQLEMTRSKQSEVHLNAQQIASSLEAAQSSAVDYSEALRAKQADFEAALRQLSNNNNKLKDVVSHSRPVEHTAPTPSTKQPLFDESPLADSDTDLKGSNVHKQKRPGTKKDSDINRSHIESLEKQIAMLKLHLHSINRRLRKSNSPQDSAMNHLHKQAHHLLNQLQQSRSVDKNHNHSNNINSFDEQAQQVTMKQSMDNSRAELEMQIRRELNKKLAILNSFLQQRAEQCDVIDRMRDENESEIRKQIKIAEKEIREHLVDIQPTLTLATVESPERSDNQDRQTNDPMKMSKSMELRDLYDNDSFGDHMEKNIRRHVTTNHPVDDLMPPEAHSSHMTVPAVTQTHTTGRVTAPNYVHHELPVWLQKQLDRSIAKHLEKAPQLQLMTTHSASKKLTCSPKSHTNMDRSVGYTSVLERNYLLI